VFWQKVGELAAPGVAEAVVRRTNDAVMAKGDLLRIVNHNIEGMMEINRIAAAHGNGLANADSFRMPYGQSVTNITTAATTQPPAPAAPKGGLLKNLATAALIGAGLGTAGFGAFYGGYQLLKDQFKAPEVKPIDLQFRAKFDPDAGGLQVVPVEPPK
jgi:hypothetical protein